MKHPIGMKFWHTGKQYEVFRYESPSTYHCKCRGQPIKLILSENSLNSILDYIEKVKIDL